MERSQNLFDTDWMKVFNLFNVPINTFCNVDGSSTNTKKLERELKTNFPEKNFLEGFCSKVKTKFNLKEDTTPIF